MNLQHRIDVRSLEEFADDIASGTKLEHAAAKYFEKQCKVLYKKNILEYKVKTTPKNTPELILSDNFRDNGDTIFEFRHINGIVCGTTVDIKANGKPGTDKACIKKTSVDRAIKLVKGGGINRCFWYVHADEIWESALERLLILKRYGQRTYLMRDRRVRGIKKYNVLANWSNCMGAMNKMDFFDYMHYYEDRNYFNKLNKTPNLLKE